MDDEIRKYFERDIEVDVWGAYLSEAELLERVPERVKGEFGPDADPELIAHLEARVRVLLDEVRQEQATWSEPTMNDAIDRAFKALRHNGIAAEQAVFYTMSDGWESVKAVASRQEEPPRGVVFFAERDLPDAVAGHGLLLTFGAYEEDPRKRPAADMAIAIEVCATLADHGVPTEWTGVMTERFHRHIVIPPFPWRRRRHDAQ